MFEQHKQDMREREMVQKIKHPVDQRLKATALSLEQTLEASLEVPHFGVVSEYVDIHIHISGPKQ